MRSVRRFVRRFVNVAMRQDDDARLGEEIESHLALMTEENLRAGMPPDEARRQAVLKFGGVQTLREDYRAERRFLIVDTFLQDVRYSLRMLRRSPGFTAVAILTFALGIGANAAIFSIVDAVLLRPLAYPHPSRLVAVFQTQPRQGGLLDGVSYQDLDAWRRQSGAFSALAGTAFHQLTLTGVGEPAEVDTISASADFFSLLQTRPILGRTLEPADGKKGAAPVAVLSEQLWRSRFAGSPAVIGRAIDLDERPFTVVGVMPASFRSPFHPNREGLWIPLVQDPLFSTWMPQWGGHWLAVVGRLKPGVSVGQAQVQMTAVAARLAKASPVTDAGWSARVMPLHRVIVGRVRTALLVLLGAVGLVLLIACANIANLLLARATARRREMGVRLALGAGRARIVRQLLTESVLLGGLGGLAGVVLAWWSVDALASHLPAGLPHLHTVGVDGRVLVFALGLSIAASLLFGLAPALLSADTSVSSTLREGTGRAGGGSERHRGRNVLAVAEIALAAVLLVGAGLLLRSFNALMSTDPGFNAEQVWMAEVDLPRYQYSKPQQWSAFADNLMNGIRSQPGLKDSAVGIPLPLADGNVNLTFTIAGNPPLPRGVTTTADYVAISPWYFRVMKIPLLAGRLFTRQDSASAPRVTIISETMARRYFPNENPIGRHMVFGFPPHVHVSREIVGVVGDVRDVSLARKPGPMMYVPFNQAPFWGAVVVMRTGLGPAAVAEAFRNQVKRIDPDLPITHFQRLSAGIDSTVAQSRFRASLLALFGLIALLLASAGIFGVISYSVSRRTRELGIRTALGATPGRIQRMVLGEGGALTAVGLAVGIAAAIPLTHVLKSELDGIAAADPLAYAGTAMLLAAVALVASYIPARRATRVDPTVALRSE